MTLEKKVMVRRAPNHDMIQVQLHLQKYVFLPIRTMVLIKTKTFHVVVIKTYDLTLTQPSRTQTDIKQVSNIQILQKAPRSSILFFRFLSVFFSFIASSAISKAQSHRSGLFKKTLKKKSRVPTQ